MPSAAPRLDPALIAELERLSLTRASPAVIRRSLVAVAFEHGLAPPSYEHVRRLVALKRLERDLESQRAAEVLEVGLDVALGIAHGSEFVHVMRGGVRRSR